MGYGLPAAIAAALVHRDRPSSRSSGTAARHDMAELETAVASGARVVVVVFDNERYGTIRMWQERRGTGVGVATELGPVDFARDRPGLRRARCAVEQGRRLRGRAPRRRWWPIRPTVIQLTLDKAWVAIDQPPG
jgi:acetolactate synthase-1/2/3 large subunit